MMSMKKLTTLLIILGIIGVASAQAPQSINYQAIAWSKDNTPRANQLIRVKISILNQSTNGPEVFNEEYQVTTNNQGLFTLEIGSLNLNDFQKINWGNGAKFLQVSIDGILIGTTKMLSVPYALYAESTNLKAGSGIGVSGNIISNTGDLDNTNEIQTLNLNGNQLSLSKNGGTVLLPNSTGTSTTYSGGKGISISPTNVISADLKAGTDISIKNDTINSTAGIPVGSIMAFAGITPPQGWLVCDGDTINQSNYPELYKTIGTIWGSGDNKPGSFNLPDLRGMFLRGKSGTSDRDPDKATRKPLNSSINSQEVGSYQEDQFQGHGHRTPENIGFFVRDYTDEIDQTRQDYKDGGNMHLVKSLAVASVVADEAYGIPKFGKETRPKNVYVLYIIKY